MRHKKILLTSVQIIIICIICIITAFAHPGNTDKKGGHKDNNNKSGLGGYHYHCGGYPAHLHPNGVCPYKTTSTSSNVASTYSKSSASTSSKYDEGFDDGYESGRDSGIEEGHEVGYVEGYDKGHDEGYDEGYDKGYEDGYHARIDEVAAERENYAAFMRILLGAILLVLLLVSLFK